MDKAGNPVTVFHDDVPCVQDPPHGWDASRAQWDLGKNDGFLVAYQQSVGAAVAPHVLGYKTRADVMPYATGVKSEYITRASRLVSTITGFVVQPNKAVVGANAFAHAAGIHQDGILKDRTNYEIMKPEDVGLADSRIVLTARSGRHAFHHRLGRLGIVLTEAQTQAAWKRFKEVADAKREVTDADLRKIVAEPDSKSLTDQSDDHNHVADALRHLIFG